MVQGQGMALKGGMPISLGQVPGVAGLGGEAKVGKPQVPDHLGFLPDQRQIAPGGEMRLDEYPCQEHQAAPGKE
jgi:hypothetical protein